MIFDEAIERALRAAEDAHRGQLRKSHVPTPYVLHPMHVALLLARVGESSEVIQAGLLHDAVEDSPAWPLERIEREFGSSVASLVAELTEDKSKSWEERKRWQVEQAATLSRGALAVKAADKLHNLRTLAETLRASSDVASVWARFKGGRERTLEHARELVDAVAARLDGPLASELRAALADVEEAALPHERREG